MPVSQFVFAFFVMFGCRSMSVRREFVLIGHLPVGVGHIFLPLRIVHAQESFLYRAKSRARHSSCSLSQYLFDFPVQLASNLQGGSILIGS